MTITPVHAFLDSTGLPAALVLVVAYSIVVYADRESYKPLLRP